MTARSSVSTDTSTNVLTDIVTEDHVGQSPGGSIKESVK